MCLGCGVGGWCEKVYFESLGTERREHKHGKKRWLNLKLIFFGAMVCVVYHAREEGERGVGVSECLCVWGGGKEHYTWGRETSSLSLIRLAA